MQSMKFIIPPTTIILTIHKNVINDIRSAIFFPGRSWRYCNINGFYVSKIENIFIVWVEAVDVGFYEGKGWYESFRKYLSFIDQIDHTSQKSDIYIYFISKKKIYQQKIYQIYKLVHFLRVRSNFIFRKKYAQK